MKEKSTTAKLESKSRLPAGLSTAEEAQWWDEHPEYWDSTGTPDEVVGPFKVQRTKPINLRLPIEMIDLLKHQADRRALPYQTLIRMWLKERLDAESQKGILSPSEGQQILGEK